MGKSGSAAVKSFDIPKALCGGVLLRPVLPVAVVSPVAAHQHLPMRRAAKKYKRLRGFRRFHAWWLGIVRHDPALFGHWRWVRTLTVAELR